MTKPYTVTQKLWLVRGFLSLTGESQPSTTKVVGSHADTAEAARADALARYPDLRIFAVAYQGEITTHYRGS